LGPNQLTFIGRPTRIGGGGLGNSPLGSCRIYWVTSTGPNLGIEWNTPAWNKNSAVRDCFVQ